MPRIVESTDAAITQAARLLEAGQVIALPTETVYGLGAAALNAQALRKLYALKGRPQNNPLIAHVLDVEQARSLVRSWPDHADALARHFWPGALTLILPKADHVPSEATAGLATIAVRAPAHPVARALLRAFGGPICAPSANRSGHVSPTRAEHVADDFAGVADLLILDGGASDHGIESTVVDLTSDPPRILRPGNISAEQIAEVLGQRIMNPMIGEQSASPGTSPRHYAPRTPIEVHDRDALAVRLSEADSPMAVLALGALSVNAPHQVIELPRDAESYAAQLYDAMRRADSMGLSVILIELPPRSSALWQAVHNRLQRAAAQPESASDDGETG